MHWNKAIAAGVTTTLLLAVSVSSAEARWYGHRGPGPVAGLIGGVIVGAATIATLPFALLADAARPAPPPGYYGQPANAYPAPSGYYGRPANAYQRPPDYYGRPAYAYPPPPPPPPRYYRYGPPPGYYGY